MARIDGSHRLLYGRGDDRYIRALARNDREHVIHTSQWAFGITCGCCVNIGTELVLLLRFVVYHGLWKYRRCLDCHGWLHL